MTRTHEYDHDVIIVGGGPAGVSCAIALAQEGKDVVILDKKTRDLIGDKNCGDAIDEDAVRRYKEFLGIEYPSGDEVSDRVTYLSIAADDIDTKLKLDGPGFVVDRLNYGQRLLKIAEEQGVKIISRAPVRGILLEEINEELFVTGVRYVKDGEKKDLTAKFTIDASGAYGAVRKSLPQSMLKDGIKHELDDDEVWPTYREIILLNDDLPDQRWQEEIILMYDDDYPPPGYFWIFSKGPRSLNVGIGWEKTQDLGKLKERLEQEFANYYSKDQYIVLKRGGGQIPFRPFFDSVVFNGGALVGDAACGVHPLSAEGHGPALVTGAQLGKVLVDALNLHHHDKEALWKFNKQIADYYGRKHMEAHVFKEFLRSSKASGLKFLMKANILRQEELNQIFEGKQVKLSITELLARAVRMLHRPLLLMKLLKLLRNIDKTREIYKEYPENPDDLAMWRIRRNQILGVKF